MKCGKLYIRIFNLLLTAVAYGYLVYKLFTFPDYDALIHHFQSALWQEYVCLLLGVVLMPMNIFLESVKWRELLRRIEPVSLVEAQRQVYFGFVGAFVTPFRAGDYPARATLMKNKALWPSAVGLGMVGTLAMLLVQLFFGLPSLLLFASHHAALPWLRIVVAFLLMLTLIAVLPPLFRQLARRSWRHEKVKQLFISLAGLTIMQFVRVLLWSMARYGVWALQLSLLLAFCGVPLSLEALLLTIPTYYLALAFFPSVPLADIAIRGSWAMIIFGVFSTNTAGIALAVSLIWLINTVLPLLIGSLQRDSVDLKQ